MTSLAERTQRVELVARYKEQLQQLNKESSFFDKLLFSHRKQLLALGDDEVQENYLLQMIKVHQHTMNVKILELDRKLASERDALSSLEVKLRECVITPPSVIPIGAVILVKGVYHDEEGVQLSLESIAPFVLTQPRVLSTDLGSRVRVLQFNNQGMTVEHPFYITVRAGADTTVKPGTLLYK
jgi:hypothetical protein